MFGICLITWGFVLKSVLVDSLSMVVDVRFNDPTVFNQWNHFIGVIFYGFQIYGDFAGYSLIAIGVARLMGFRFNQNFDSPYFSSSFSQFWRKWHISLSNWLRDYLYISLGGNRTGTLKMYRNLMVTMILGGLWHGASFNFVIWGFIHGTYLCIEKIFSKNRGEFNGSEKGYSQKILRIIFVQFLVFITWVFFRSESLSDSIHIIQKLLNLGGYKLDELSSIQQKFHVVEALF